MPLDYSGLSAYRSLLRASGARAPAAAGASVNQTGSAVANSARGNAPVLTGELRASIHVVRTGPTSVEVRADAPYAGYVEEGTSKMAPEPYMGPAADAHEGELPLKLVERVVTGL